MMSSREAPVLAVARVCSASSSKLPSPASNASVIIERSRFVIVSRDQTCPHAASVISVDPGSSTVLRRTHAGGAVLDPEHRLSGSALPADIVAATHDVDALIVATRQGHILRIGAGGDLATREDGEAWAAALHWAGEYRPTLRAWIYSRSYELPGQDDPLGPIADGIADGRITNTAAYLSTDPEMVDRTRRALYGGNGWTPGRYSHLAVAVLADDHAQGAAILEELRRPNRPLVCPVDREVRTWRTADRRPGDPYASGACSRCRACIEPTGRRTWQQDVIFPRR